MTAQGATSGSPFFDDYRVEASTGNAASPSTVFLQLGNWISAPLFPHFWQRAFLRKTSVDASGPKRMTALQEPDGVSLLQEVRQFGDVRGDPPGFIARQPVREATTHGLVFEIHVSQRPAVCIFDNEAFAVLNNTPGRGKPTGFGRLSHVFLESRANRGGDVRPHAEWRLFFLSTRRDWPRRQAG